MGETSRREFLISSAAAAAVVSGSSFFEDETLFANSSKSLAVKKGLVYRNMRRLPMRSAILPAGTSSAAYTTL